MQTILCDACGHVQCASGGWVHISRLGEYVLWSAPQSSEHEDESELYTLRALARAGQLPIANHAAVADAWTLVEQQFAALLERAEEPFDRPIVSAAGARIETLYFDGPSELDWPAFALTGDRVSLALDREHIAE